MKDFFKKVLAYVGGAIVYYLLTVLVLVVLESAFGDTFTNKFISAVPVWVLGHVLLIAYAVIARALKKAKQAREQAALKAELKAELRAESEE